MEEGGPSRMIPGTNIPDRGRAEKHFLGSRKDWFKSLPPTYNPDADKDESDVDTVVPGTKDRAPINRMLLQDYGKHLDRTIGREVAYHPALEHARRLVGDLNGVRAAQAAQGNTSVTHNHNYGDVTVGDIHTQAKDAGSIARDLTTELKRNLHTANANRGAE